MAFLDDFSIDFATGAIRHTGGTDVHTVLDLHAGAQDRSDDTDAIDDDNPTELAGKRDAAIPAILSLPNNGPEGTVFNIDDTAAQYLNFGSISQLGGAELYSGLKTIGGIAAASPMYVLQDGAKLTKFWPDGHIQILVKVRTGGALIDGGDVTVLSRKYGQTYSVFDVNLAAGSESSAAMQTVNDGAVTLTEPEAAAVLAAITVTPGDVPRDLGNGAGSRTYGGVIDCAGERLADVYQALQYLTREGSATTINGTPGEQYRKLKAGYVEVTAAPFGTFAGGTFFVAQGWFLDNVPAQDATAFELIDDSGARQAPPVTAIISVGNLIAGDSVIVTRIDGTGAPIKDEYTAAAGNNAGSATFTINEGIKSDTPDAGRIRVDDGQVLEYVSYAGSVFTLSGTISTNIGSGADCYVPLIDRVADAAQETASYLSAGDLELGVTVRHSAVNLISFRGTINAGALGGSINTVRNLDV